MLLDTGPLGLVTHPRANEENERAARWLKELRVGGADIRIPAISDYELRRELLRANKMRSVRTLDSFKAALGFVPLGTEAMLRAAEFWAEARRQGKPTAPDPALDGDVILAGQAVALAAEEQAPEVVVATANVGHLARFVTAQDWRSIEAL